MNKSNENECNASVLLQSQTCTPTPLIDRLKAKRSQIARDANTRVRKLDRQIALLAQSDAEQIMHEAEDALNNG